MLSEGRREGLRLPLNRCLSDPGETSSTRDSFSPDLPQLFPPAVVSMPSSPCTESTTLQRSLLLRRTKVIKCEDLARKLPRARAPFLLVDLRPFITYNLRHIRGAINLSCSDRFSRKRLQLRRAAVADLAASPSGRELLKKRSFKEVVVYDDSTQELESLASQHPVFLVLLALLEDNREPVLLEGGFREFEGSYPEFCEDALMRSHSGDYSLSSNCDLNLPEHLPNESAIEEAVATEVLPFLLLGNAKDAENLGIQGDLGVTSILNVTCQSPQHHLGSSLPCKTLPAYDSGHQNLRQYFEEAISFIDEARRSDGRVLVHCQAGVSRSPTIVIAYLMKHSKMSMVEAYKWVKVAQDSEVDFASNFLRQILRCSGKYFIIIDLNTGIRKRRGHSQFNDCKDLETMEPTAKKMSHELNCGGKKKRELDKRMTSADLLYDWTEKNELIVITLIVGSGHDNKNVNINVDRDKISVSLLSGKKFQTPLYAPVEPEGTNINFKSTKCIIKLLKNDPTISWPTLWPSMPQTDSSQCVTKPTVIEKKIEGELIPEGKVIGVVNPKTDIVELDGENKLYVYLYVKSINKDNISVKFTEETMTVRFTTSDLKFLKNYDDAMEDDIFEWNVKFKGKVIDSDCTFKVTANNLEIKLKKSDFKPWLSLSPMPPVSDAGDIYQNIFSGMNAPTEPLEHTSVKSEGTCTSTIPVPPPAPEVKKPTCLVSPVSKGTLLSSSSLYGETNVPTFRKGLTGLDNIGNTCFMNSVLQCLINTKELQDYFLNYNFQEDLNKDNPLGMGGNLAVSFAFLMRVLWDGNVRSHPPSKLKSIMSMKANQFSGFAQHDAQEFMVELLDGLHEDLNRIKNKPYIAEPPDLDGWPEEEAANESWKLHKMRNDSVIDDLFKGQFKSTLTCHECGKVSVKFDEFCCLSVPIPKDQKIIPVIFFWKDPYEKPKKFYIQLCADALVEELKYQLSLETDVDSSCIQVIEVYKSRIHKVFGKGANLSSVTSTDRIMAFEIYNKVQVREPVVEIAVTQRMVVPSPPTKCSNCTVHAGPGIKLRRCTRCYRAGYCDQSCQKNHWTTHKVQCRIVPEPVGCPFIMSFPESHATYSNIARLMEAYASQSVDIFQPPVSQIAESGNSRGSVSSDDLSNEESEEMEVDDSDGLEVPGTNGDNAVDYDWMCGGASCGSGNHSFMDELPQLSSSPSIRAVQPRGVVQLAQGSRLFNIRSVTNKGYSLVSPLGEALEDKGDELINFRDKYYFAMDWKTNERLKGHCLVQNKEINCEVKESLGLLHQRNQTTTLEACIDLFTQPENLMEGDSWQCPRCKKPVEATKQMNIWRLPNILIIQLKRFSFKCIAAYSDKIDKFVQYPISGLNIAQYMSKPPPDGSAVYDLYGVINHMGRLLGGHYTAYARCVNPENSRQSEIEWRLFDDSRVSFIDEQRVVSEQAYLLLYHRQDTPFALPHPLPHHDNNNSGSIPPDDDIEPEEPVLMSVSSISRPSSSSPEGEEASSAQHDELD